MAAPPDVAIVGYGPVGQSLAILLGRRGWRVTVFDRQSTLFPLPRACHLDHEAMRIIQAMGIAGDVGDVVVPAREYLLLRPDLSVLSALPRGWETPSGWESSYHFFQPEVEGILDGAAKSTPGVTVRQATAVRSVEDLGDEVLLVVEGAEGTIEEVRARFVIAADGANSTVREQLGIGREDLGFESTWVVVDVEVEEGSDEPDVPDTGQVLDPRQPRHMAWLGGRHYRWEFMVIDGGDPAEAAAPERIWSTLRNWVDPASARLLRSSAYTFQSLIAETFNRGRVLLAGDAAHLMPPFMGQGMVSGLRDAATIAWILDLVLRGTAPVRFLDAYTASRRPHVRAYIAESMRVGQLVCETDPVKAAIRDRELEAQDSSPPPFQPSVGDLFVEGPLAGRLAVQPRIASEGDRLLDDVLESRFALLTTDPRLLDGLDAQSREIVLAVGIASAAIVAEGTTPPVGRRGVVLVERASRFSDWLGRAAADWVLVRPDGYVYDAGAGAAALDRSLRGLGERVGVRGSVGRERGARRS